MTVIEFVMIALAAWYVAHCITKESGPFNLFGRVRSWARRNIKEGERTPDGSFAEAIECVYCMAFWVGLLVYLLWLTPAQPLVLVLAIAGGALVAERWIRS